MPGWRLLLSRTLSCCYRCLLRRPIRTWTSCFRLYRRSAVADLPLANPGFLGTAELLVNYYYDPAVSALVSAAVDYISPVKGSDELLVAAHPEDADNPLISPPADWVERLHIFGALTEEQDVYFNEQFAKVIGV